MKRRGIFCEVEGLCLIRASLSEPHINGTAVRELYIYYYGTSVTRNIYAQYGSMDISVKYSIAHSHA